MDGFFAELWQARAAFAIGLARTLEISAEAIFFGTILGVLVGINLVFAPIVLKIPLRAYVDVVRGTPVLVLILASFYMPAVIGISLNAQYSGTLALTLFAAGHIGEIVRGALQAIPPGQMEAAKSVGLTFLQTIAYVLMPQALRLMLPTWINTGVELVKGSTLLSVIGVSELLLTTQEVAGRNFMTMQFYLFAGLLYVIVNLSLDMIGKMIEKRISVR